MPKFLTPLRVEQVDDAMWRLTAPLGYASGICGIVDVPVGFETDFCSVPRLPLAFMVDGNIGQRAGVVHDFLYSDPHFSRAVADAVLREALMVCDVGWFRAGTMWVAVRCFGWLYKKNVKGD